MASIEHSQESSLVRTTCWRCGVIEVPITNVILRVDEETATGNCILRCPLCSTHLTQPACDAMMTALVAVGVEISLVVPPLDVCTDTSLTVAEIDRFVDRLGTEADLVRLIHPDEPPFSW